MGKHSLVIKFFAKERAFPSGIIAINKIAIFNVETRVHIP